MGLELWTSTVFVLLCCWFNSKLKNSDWNCQTKKACQDLVMARKKGFSFLGSGGALRALGVNFCFLITDYSSAVLGLWCCYLKKKKKEWILPNSKNKDEDKSRHWSYSVLLVKFQGEFSFAPCNNVDKGTPFCFICEFSMTQKPSKKTTTCLWFI